MTGSLFGDDLMASPSGALVPDAPAAGTAPRLPVVRAPITGAEGPDFNYEFRPRPEGFQFPQVRETQISGDNEGTGKSRTGQYVQNSRELAGANRIIRPGQNLKVAATRLGRNAVRGIKNSSGLSKGLTVGGVAALGTGMIVNNLNADKTANQIIQATQTNPPQVPSPLGVFTTDPLKQSTVASLQRWRASPQHSKKTDQEMFDYIKNTTGEGTKEGAYARTWLQLTKAKK
jgi:hypothetical protein